MIMNISQVRDLAVKLLGLYYLITAIAYLPQLVGLFTISGKDKEFITHMGFFILSAILPAILYFIAAFFLLIKTSFVLRILWLHEDSVPATPTTLTLTTGISLIGFFYLIGSLGGLSVELYILSINREMWGSSIQYKYLPNIVSSVLSLICIIKARKIAEFLKSKIE